jgi:prepilin peptidase CpaA
MIDLPFLVDLAVAAALLSAAGSDLLRRRIPNLFCLWVAGFALVSQALALAPEELWRPLAAGTVSFALLLPLWQRRLLGGGDLKLFVATSLWAGLDGLLQLALAVALAGGVLALLVLAAETARTRLLPLLATMPWVCVFVPAAALTESSESRASLPYGVAIAAGAIWQWLAR